jgi:hypothetical protein
MIWKTIGQSIIGTSHVAAGKVCDDANRYTVLTDTDGKEILVAAICDGAGSAANAAFAANLTCEKVLEFASHLVAHREELTEAQLYAMAEDIYGALELEAANMESPLNEYSCTLLGCIITEDKAAFFQIGDGAIIRYNTNETYSTVWWPQNGEYHNSTSFLIDDPNLPDLRVVILDERIDELAIFTDGLQMLTLNMESQTVHAPFFTSLFRLLRMADSADKTEMLNKRLAEYLDSTQINERTDDDKTLFLATRLKG